MFLITDYFLNPDREFGALWDRVLAAWTSRPAVFGPPHLHLKDSGIAASRLLKAYASLTPYLSLNRPRPHSGPEPGAALPIEELMRLLTEVAHGIPRRFPAQWIIVTLPWAVDIAPEIPAELRGYPSPGQDMEPWYCGLKVSRKVNENWLVATVPVVKHADNASPGTAGMLNNIVAAIAPTRWTETRVLLSPSETQHARQLEHRMEALVQSGRGMLAAICTPSPPVENDKPVRAFRQQFEKAVKRRGFGYRPDLSQPRYHVARKRTEHGNVLELVLDVGGFGPPWSPSVDLQVRTLGQKAVTLPLIPQAYVLGKRQWSASCETLLTLLDRAESQWVPEVEQHLGSSPSWFNDLGNIAVCYSRPQAA